MQARWPVKIRNENKNVPNVNTDYQLCIPQLIDCKMWGGGTPVLWLEFKTERDAYEFFTQIPIIFQRKYQTSVLTDSYNTYEHFDKIVTFGRFTQEALLNIPGLISQK